MPQLMLPEQFGKLLATTEPPGLGPERRAQTLTETAVNDAVRAEVLKLRLPDEWSDLIRCAVLLWHDHLDAAHQIAQAIETTDGSWLHGIMHRREMDYGNAKYWFRRTDSHPAFSELAVRVRPLLQEPESGKPAARLIKAGDWDPFAFVDAVEAALRPGGSDAERACLRQLQAVELETVLDHFLSH